MKKLLLFVVCLSLSFFIKAQTISPVESTEFCPLVNITFTVTVPGTNPILIPSTNNPIISQSPYNSSTNNGITTFNFVGRFRDENIVQKFAVTYNNSNGTPITRYFFI